MGFYTYGEWGCVSIMKRLSMTSIAHSKGSAMVSLRKGRSMVNRDSFKGIKVHRFLSPSWFLWIVQLNEFTIISTFGDTVCKISIDFLGDMFRWMIVSARQSNLNSRGTYETTTLSQFTFMWSYLNTHTFFWLNSGSLVPSLRQKYKYHHSPSRTTDAATSRSILEPIRQSWRDVTIKSFSNRRDTAGCIRLSETRSQRYMRTRTIVWIRRICGSRAPLNVGRWNRTPGEYRRRRTSRTSKTGRAKRTTATAARALRSNQPSFASDESTAKLWLLTIVFMNLSLFLIDGQHS